MADDIERVAEAIWKAEWIGVPPDTWNSVDAEEPERAEAYRALARAAIASMEGDGPRWIDFEHGKTAVEFGTVYLALDASGKLFNGFFVAHRIPDEAVKILPASAILPPPPTHSGDGE